MATKRQTKAQAEPGHTPPIKLDILVNLLNRDNGATLAEMAGATGWQAHSVRGALAGALKKRGHAITSAKRDGARYYQIG